MLAGCAGVEKAAANGGHDVTVPFTPGRTGRLAGADRRGFPLNTWKPFVDGFRNYRKEKYSLPAEHLLIDRAQLLTLTAPEMTVLVGGMRAMNANFDGSKHGVFTDRPEALSNDFFKVVVDMGIAWAPQSEDDDYLFEGRGPQQRRAEVDRHPSGSGVSAPTPSCARFPKSTARTTRRRSSSRTSSPPGTR